MQLNSRNDTKILDTQGRLGYSNEPQHDYGQQQRQRIEMSNNNNLNNSFQDQYNANSGYIYSQSQPHLPLNTGRSNTVARKDYKSKVTQLSVFPMYGLWDGKTTFKSQKQIDQSYSAKYMNEKHIQESQVRQELANVDRGHFRKVYFEKTYMEELLKMKNMMGKVKK